MKLEVSILKEHASGRWPEVIRSLAPQLSSTIERGRRHGPCDLCGGKDRCRCHNDFAESGGIICNQCVGGADGFAVLCWANSWTFRESLEAIADYLGLTDDSLPIIRKHTARQQPKKDWTDEYRRLESVWNESEVNSVHLKTYFKCRGLSVEPPPTLRFHHALFHYLSKEHFPAMIARIIKGNSFVGLHRTFLDSHGHGKAPVSNPKLSKKCVESMSGGAIQIFDPKPDKPLVLCEGIETGLAVHEFTNWPVWSCVSSSMLKKVELPERVKSVVICGDKDCFGAGEYSSEILAQRLISEGREVKISLPPIGIPENSTSVDWLDFLAQEVAHVR
jgi:hypothetical protein